MGYRKDAERFKGTTGGICMGEKKMVSAGVQ
jgi:hypothetical protein